MKDAIKRNAAPVTVSGFGAAAMLAALFADADWRVKVAAIAGFTIIVGLQLLAMGWDKEK